MHELSVTESLIEIVTRHALEADAQRVVRIHLVIGELASIVDDSVQFYFDFLAKDTVAAEAELVFNRVPVTLECPTCGHQWQPDTADWSCPECQSARARPIAGKEFYVESIEVE